MSYRPSRRGKAPFVRIRKEVMDSERWCKLSHAARTVYLELLKQNNGTDPENLSLPYSLLVAKYGMNHSTIRKAFQALEKGGFIKIVRHGGLERRCNIYALTDSWYYRASK